MIRLEVLFRYGRPEVKYNILKRNIYAISVFLLSILVSAVTTLGGWGVERGRADAGDAARLLVDKLAMTMAQKRISEAVSRPLRLERALQITGLFGTHYRSDQLMDAVYEWWKKDVMGPAQAIAANPAASCTEAQIANQTLLGMMRQRSLLGMSPEDDNDHSALAEQARALDTELNEMFKAINTKVLTRCREEALDECVMTGRFEQIVQTEMGIGRQDSLLGTAGREDHETWMDETLKQCAIYELHFVSAAKINGEPKIDTVVEGKMTIKFEMGAGGILGALKGGKLLRDILYGQTEGSANPFLVSIKCEFPPEQVTCGPGATPTNPFRAIIEAMELQHTVYGVNANGASEQSIAGKNKLSLEFDTGGMMSQAVVKFRDRGNHTPPSMTLPIEAGGTAFAIAHKKDRIGNAAMYKFEREKRGVYPIIFDFVYASQDVEGGVSATDSTEFKLIHKPKPVPIERKTEPTRQPLKPRTAVKKIGG